MAVKSSYEFYHAADARRQGVGMLIFVHLFMFAFCGILFLFHTRLGMKIDETFLFGMGSVMALVYLGILVYSLILIIKGGQWIFAVRDGVLCVRSPGKSVGAAFSISVSDIVSITQAGGETEHSMVRFYVVSKDGEKHEITQNSDLNLEKFFMKLRELNPDIREEFNTVPNVWNVWRSRFGKRRA
jgi:hypothetical protein